MTYEYEHQFIKVEPLGKSMDNRIRVSKQDNHYFLDREYLPDLVDFLKYATISSLSVVEMSQILDDLKRIERDRL